MKATINTTTGLMIESQSDEANDAALIANAVALGITAGDVEIRTVTQSELDALIAARTPISNRIAYIEEQYEIREHADIVYLGATFQADDESQKLIDRVLAATNGATPAGFGWYDITNTKVPMTNAELQGLAAAILLRNQPLFDNKQAKKAAIRAAATVAEVEAITW